MLKLNVKKFLYSLALVQAMAYTASGAASSGGLSDTDEANYQHYVAQKPNQKLLQRQKIDINDKTAVLLFAGLQTVVPMHTVPTDEAHYRVALVAANALASAESVEELSGEHIQKAAQSQAGTTAQQIEERLTKIAAEHGLESEIEAISTEHKVRKSTAVSLGLRKKYANPDEAALRGIRKDESDLQEKINGLTTDVAGYDEQLNVISPLAGKTLDQILDSVKVLISVDPSSLDASFGELNMQMGAHEVAEKEVESKQAELDKLPTILEDKIKEIEKVSTAKQGELTTAQTALTAATDELTRLQGEHAGKVKALEEAKTAARIGELETAAQQKKSIFEQISAEYKTTKQKLDDLTVKIAAGQAELDNFMTNISTPAINTFKDAVENFDKANKNTALADLVDEIDGLEDAVVAGTAQQEDLNTEQEKLEAILNTAGNENLRKTYETMMTALAKAEEISQTLQESKDKLPTLTEKEVDLKAQLPTAETEFKNAGQALTDAKAPLKTLEDEVEVARGKVEKALKDKVDAQKVQAGIEGLINEFATAANIVTILKDTSNLSTVDEAINQLTIDIIKNHVQDIKNSVATVVTAKSNADTTLETVSLLVNKSAQNLINTLSSFKVESAETPQEKIFNFLAGFLSEGIQNPTQLDTFIDDKSKEIEAQKKALQAQVDEGNIKLGELNTKKAELEAKIGTKKAPASVAAPAVVASPSAVTTTTTTSAVATTSSPTTL